jgi:DNA-binding transcriptional ArsR family regulator
MAISKAVTVLKAAADPTRLRLLALLAGGEATVGELVEVLDQSQPRVSRHLKILAEAGLVDHFRDGQWMYYRLFGPQASGELVAELIALGVRGDRAIDADRARMAEVRTRRERYALTAPTGPRHRAEPVPDRPDERALGQALDEALGGGFLGDVLDIGVGSGTLLRLLGARARSAVGLDTARGMRVLARARLQAAGVANSTIRVGDMHTLPFGNHAFDVVILDEVLGLTDQPLRALEEATRVLRPSGRLLILDRILPAARRLPGYPAQRCLFENQLAVLLRGLGLRVAHRVWFPGRTLELALFTAAMAQPQLRTGTDE